MIPTAATLELPLGWSFNCSAAEPEHFSVVTLPSGANFVYAAQVSPATTLAQIVERLRALGERVILRSCPDALARALGRGELLTLSSSARIDLRGYRPPHKVRNLARRGAGAVEVRELDVAGHAAANQWLTRLRAGTPALKYVFRDRVTAAERTFSAFAPGADEPVGLVTLSRYGQHAWHLELLCRAPQAPTGAMEHLLSTVIETLIAEGATTLNLGEVPLDFSAQAPTLTWLNRLLVFLAPAVMWLLRGRYDVAGLHRFKNKFAPTWEPRYYVGLPRLPLRDLRHLSELNGTRALVWPRWGRGATR